MRMNSTLYSRQAYESMPGFYPTWGFPTVCGTPFTAAQLCLFRAMELENELESSRRCCYTKCDGEDKLISLKQRQNEELYREKIANIRAQIPCCCAGVPTTF